MAIQTMQQDGGLGDITNLLNLVKDQKTTSSTTSNLTDAGVQAQINNILGSNQGLAAVAGAQHSAGFYNSTVNTQLVNDLLTRTAAQVQAQKAGSTTTQTKKAPVSSSQALMTIGSLALKNSDKAKAAYKYLTGKFTGTPGSASAAEQAAADATPNAAVGASDLSAGSGVTAGTSSDLSAFIGNTPTAVSSTGDITTAVGDVLGSAGYTGEAAAASGNDVAGLTALDSAAASEGASTAAAGTDAAGLAALDSAAVDSEGASGVLAAGDSAGAADAGLGSAEGISAAAPWAALAVASAIDAGSTLSGDDSNAKDYLKFTGDIGTSDVIRGFDSGNITDSVNPLGQGLLNSIGATDTVNSIGKSTGWIVCTELVRQGRMPRKYYVPGLRVFQSYRLDLLDGYYIWARPTVALLQEKPYCLRSRFVSWLFNHRAEYLASRSGVAGAVDSFVGASISAAVYGFCYVLGQYLKYTNNAEQGEFV